MSFSVAELSDSLLSWIVIYGSGIIFLTLLLGAVGLPAPGTLVVLAAGAFVRQEVLDLPSALAFALVGVLLGDTLSYGMGRFARGPILNRFGDSAAWQNAEANFNRRGGLAVYLTRWLLTPLAIPTNLVAGSAGYPFMRFISFDLAGELTWLLLFGSLGYLFGSQFEAVSAFIGDFSGLLVGLVIVGAGAYFVLRRRKSPKPVVTPAERPEFS
jgi:membrane protein DedA with SNARE-associated domain